MFEQSHNEDLCLNAQKQFVEQMHEARNVPDPERGSMSNNIDGILREPLLVNLSVVHNEHVCLLKALHWYCLFLDIKWVDASSMLFWPLNMLLFYLSFEQTWRTNIFFITFLQLFVYVSQILHLFGIAPTVMNSELQPCLFITSFY